MPGASTELKEVWFRHPTAAWASGQVVGADASSSGQKVRIRPHNSHSSSTDGVCLADADKCVKYDSTHVQPLEDIAKVSDLYC